MYTLGRWCPHLIELELSECGYSDEGLISIAQGCPSMQVPPQALIPRYNPKYSHQNSHYNHKTLIKTLNFTPKPSFKNHQRLFLTESASETSPLTDRSICQVYGV
jgi:hypothetical protein